MLTCRHSVNLKSIFEFYFFLSLDYLSIFAFTLSVGSKVIVFDCFYLIIMSQISSFITGADYSK